ncbi:MAG: hypothetical protein MI864_14090, partial [Pseudomonadales bacterium]|nr:hypothetical protein [Pseudomonadales bacterium]
MPFNTFTFFIFFCCFFLLFSIVSSWKAKKCLILLSSIIFYAAWNPLFVFLLLGSTVVDFFIGLKLGRSTDNKNRKAWVAASLIVNLGVLGFFKYSQFFLDSMTELAAVVGWKFVSVDLGILLPVGISFYTFQTLSYT